MAHAKREKDQSDQFREFRKAARELGCDSDEGQFQDALRTVAKAKPSEKGRRLRSSKE